MEKVRYEMDPYNRLMVTGGKKSGARRYRLKLDGYFKTGNDNSLRYMVKSPYNNTPYGDLPHRIDLKGRYSLTTNHDLLFTVSRSRKQRYAEQLTLRGGIVSVDKNSLTFAVTTRQGNGTSFTRSLVLNGRWNMDADQRIVFSVRRDSRIDDDLIFASGWKITKANEIEYSYKRSGRTGKKVRTLTFKGRWEFINDNRIRYKLSLKDNSAFELQAVLVRAGFLGKRSALIYKMGAKAVGELAAKNGSSKIRYLKFFGEWKVTRNAGLLFEIRYSGKKTDLIAFGAKARLNKYGELALMLRNKDGESLGVEVTLKKRFLGSSGEALVKLLASKKEKSIMLGAGKLF